MIELKGLAFFYVILAAYTLAMYTLAMIVSCPKRLNYLRRMALWPVFWLVVVFASRRHGGAKK